MATRVMWNEAVATFDDEALEWRSDVAGFAQLLNSILVVDPVTGSDPNPASTSARKAKAILEDLEILEEDLTDPVVKNVDY